MSEVEISDELLDRYRLADHATVWTMLTRRMQGPVVMQGVQSFTPGTKMVGRARTLRYLPVRRIIDGPTPFVGADTPEFRAMGRCGPGDVLVCDFLRTTGSGNIGDVKSYMLKQRSAEGIVSDGSLRDFRDIESYGLKVFAAGHTMIAGTGNGILDQYEENVPISCGGVRVDPGDLLIGSDDGVLVVPKELAAAIIDQVEEYEEIEAYIKGLADKEGVPPGTYYPPSAEFIARYRSDKLARAEEGNRHD